MGYGLLGLGNMWGPKLLTRSLFGAGRVGRGPISFQTCLVVGGGLAGGGPRALVRGPASSKPTQVAFHSLVELHVSFTFKFKSTSFLALTVSVTFAPNSTKFFLPFSPQKSRRSRPCHFGFSIFSTCGKNIELHV